MSYINLSNLLGANKTIPIEVFAVGGGGGGANYTSSRGGSGGGAGMVIYKRMDVRIGTTYNIRIGGAGAGAAIPSISPPTVSVSGSSGGNTSFGSLTAYGGSGGDMSFNGGNVPSLMNYGSVGGGTGPSKIDNFSSTFNAPTLTYYHIVLGKSDFHQQSSQSFDADGGFVGVNGWNYSYLSLPGTLYDSGTSSPGGNTATGAEVPFAFTSSGGGGAGGEGQANNNSVAAPFGGALNNMGAGGYGVWGTFVGLTTTYAGGGGAGNNNPNANLGSYSGGFGRDGGGSGAAGSTTQPGGNAAANRGGGGGGGAILFPNSYSGSGGSGGSGFLFIRYPTAYAAATVTANAPVTAQPGYNVYGWTSGPATIVFN